MKFREEIMGELALAVTSNDATKDILVIVHDQLTYVRQCLEGVLAHTENAILHVWDNASGPETAGYLEGLRDAGHILLTTSTDNLGFIEPNNRLAAGCHGDYLILLNSDCEVRSGWDLAMINHLEQHPGCGQVGYRGQLLDEHGEGVGAAYGDGAAFICGWCFCLPGSAREATGLFDGDHLKFAYGEDSDLSLRIRESGKSIYSLHCDLVVHHGNKTIEKVRGELGDYVSITFARNHEYIRRRWCRFLPGNSYCRLF